MQIPRWTFLFSSDLSCMSLSLPAAGIIANVLAQWLFIMQSSQKSTLILDEITSSLMQMSRTGLVGAQR